MRSESKLTSIMPDSDPSPPWFLAYCSILIGYCLLVILPFDRLYSQAVPLNTDVCISKKSAGLGHGNESSKNKHFRYSYKFYGRDHRSETPTENTVTLSQFSSKSMLNQTTQNPPKKWILKVRFKKKREWDFKSRRRPCSTTGPYEQWTFNSNRGTVTLRRGSWLATAAGSCSSTTTPHSAGAVLGKPASWVALSVLLLHTHSWELPSWNRTAILPRLWHCDKERALKGTGHRSSLGLSFIPWPPTDGCSDAIGWGRKRFYW